MADQVEQSSAEVHTVSPRVKRTIWYAIGAVVLTVCLWYVASQLTDLMVTIAICFFLAFALEPIVNAMAARGWKRGRATLLIYVVGLIAIAIFTILFGKMLVDQVIGLVSMLPDTYARVQDWLSTSFGVQIPDSQDLVREYLNNAVSAMAGSVLGLVGSFLGFVFGALTVLFVSFYLIAQGPSFRRTVCSVLPPARQREVLNIWNVAIDKVSGYLLSRSILAAICATFTSIFLIVIRVPYGLALGIFVGVVAQFVPTIGTYIAGVIPVVVAFGSSPWQGIATLAFILAYQQVENLTIEPRISAKAMELNPAVSFVSVIAGAAILGPIGAFLALPFAGTVKAFVSTYVHRNELVESELLTEAADRPQKSRWRKSASPEDPQS